MVQIPTGGNFILLRHIDVAILHKNDQNYQTCVIYEHTTIDSKLTIIPF